MFKLVVTCGLVCLCLNEGQAAQFTVTMAFNTPVDQGSNVTMTCGWNNYKDITRIAWYKGQYDWWYPTYFYTKSGTPAINSALHATVTRIRVEEEDEGDYWCRVYWRPGYDSYFQSSNALKLSVTALSTTSKPTTSAKTSPGDQSTTSSTSPTHSTATATSTRPTPTPTPTPTLTPAPTHTHTTTRESLSTITSINTYSTSKNPTTADVEKDQVNGETTVAAWDVTELDGTAVANMMPLSVGVIAGATVGGVVLLAVVGAILFIVWKRRKYVNQEDNIEGNSNPPLPNENETAVDLDEAVYITPSPGTYESLQTSPGTYESLQTSPGTYESLQTSPGTYESLQTSPGTYESLQTSPGTYESLQIPPQLQGNPDSMNNH